jgi:hypothetical protein
MAAAATPTKAPVTTPIAAQKTSAVAAAADVTRKAMAQALIASLDELVQKSEDLGRSAASFNEGVPGVSLSKFQLETLERLRGEIRDLRDGFILGVTGYQVQR